MSKKDLKKGDEVVVISGKHQGRRGKILKVLAPKNRKNRSGKTLPTTAPSRILVEGINLAKHHEKKQGRQEGGINEHEAPIYRSKLALATTYDNRKNNKAQKPPATNQPEKTRDAGE
ncbi:MAG: 50S ribosomal protein L24 [Puniceicoccales bacterium]|jgi:ribosomal protein L24|nr:50S ribosomal protein L24 [Puniceicoccales bacterium]